MPDFHQNDSYEHTLRAISESIRRIDLKINVILLMMESFFSFIKLSQPKSAIPKEKDPYDREKTTIIQSANLKQDKSMDEKIVNTSILNYEEPIQLCTFSEIKDPVMTENGHILERKSWEDFKEKDIYNGEKIKIIPSADLKKVHSDYKNLETKFDQLMEQMMKLTSEVREQNQKITEQNQRITELTTRVDQQNQRITELTQENSMLKIKVKALSIPEYQDLIRRSDKIQGRGTRLLRVTQSEDKNHQKSQVLTELKDTDDILGFMKRNEAIIKRSTIKDEVPSFFKGPVTSRKLFDKVKEKFEAEFVNLERENDLFDKEDQNQANLLLM